MRLGRVQAVTGLGAPYLAVLLCGLAFATLPAAAEPLSGTACGALDREQQTLLGYDLKADMARGPEWAKINLGQQRLEMIERLITVEEQLTFRCKGVKRPKAIQANAPDSKTSGVKQPAKTAATEVGAVANKDAGQTPTAKTETGSLPEVVPLRQATKPRKARKISVKKRKRRKRKRRADTYVPPPPRPGYLPSLGNP